MAIRLSVLDQSLVFEGETDAEAIGHTIELAQIAEKLGYYRFWVAEHHDSAQMAGSAPEVLIAHLLAKTSKMRIGSGGVMLQHYSPYKVAEQFNVLACLAPGRVDLGIGRAPGGLPRSTRALQQGQGDGRPLEDKLRELRQYLHNKLEDHHPLLGLQATPIPPQPAAVYLLGASVASAELAAGLGLPYVFALFINNDESIAYEAVNAYRKRLAAAGHPHCQPLLALPIIVADSDEEAKQLAKHQKIVKIHLESGKTLTVTSEELAEEFGRQTTEKYRIEVKEARIIAGSKATVGAKLRQLQQRLGVAEFIAISVIQDFSKRVRSYELLKEAVAESFPKQGEP
ncbi:LLM class flavin-dependent oxidoreductase [Brevibacillus marinus]|uniref:LLM class flavin-dependent oxidoreductase n=1 Tax=Brevibacillus marinus TaxID=2496837 RepID=UPI000F824425|nr:LLM class flavin-dependent oxidoreductase [Brevibacillus marinus]